MDIQHLNAQSHGTVDFSVGLEANDHLLLVEAKATNWDKGKAQNILQMECALWVCPISCY